MRSHHKDGDTQRSTDVGRSKWLKKYSLETRYFCIQFHMFLLQDKTEHPDSWEKVLGSFVILEKFQISRCVLESEDHFPCTELGLEKQSI